jgi:hypothetical protein
MKEQIMHIQTQPTSNYSFEPAISHKFPWASLVTGLTALTFVGGAVFLLLSAAEDREVPHSSLSIGSGKSDETVSKDAFSFDHSVVNRENLPDEPNPGPMAIAAYE